MVKSTHLREMRDEALYDAYVKALESHNFRSQAEALDYVRTHESPRFYISAQFCWEIISQMLRGIPTYITGNQSKRKFAELFRRYQIESQKPEYKGYPQELICEIIVGQPAPEFYINARTTRSIITRQREIRQRQFAKEWASRD